MSIDLEGLRATATVRVRDGFRWFKMDPGLMSVTLEDAEFLYALVRVTKPLAVVESGTGNGISGKFIGEALKANGHGALTTYEPLRVHVDPARALIGPDVPVTVVNEECPGWREGDSTDLVFLDSAPTDRRQEEMSHWLNCGYEGIVVVHDAARDYPELRGRGVYLPGADGLWIGRGR